MINAMRVGKSGQDEADRDMKDIHLWSKDEVNPSSHSTLDTFSESNSSLFWTDSASYRRVSETDMEVFIKEDDSVLLIKDTGSIFILCSHNNDKTGI